MSCSWYKYIIHRVLKNHGRWDQDFLVKMEGNDPYRGMSIDGGLNTAFHWQYMDFVAIMPLASKFFIHVCFSFFP